MRNLLLFSLVFFTIAAQGQQLAGNELLERAIAYHDPDGDWPSFRGQLSITTKAPDKDDRTSEIILDLPSQYFKLTAMGRTLCSFEMIRRTSEHKF